MSNEFLRKTLCLIPARKSSKRIKKKNKKIINGKPLIAWTIEFAKNNFKPDNIYVSSDDEDILKISRKKKVNFIKRPKKFSNSRSKSIDVVKHFLNKIKSNNFENIILLQPTSPFRRQKTLKKIISTYIRNNLNSIVTVSKNIKDKKNRFYIDESFRLCRKKTNLIVRINGNLYLTKIKYLEKFSRIYEKNSKVCITNNTLESLDIDINKDWTFLKKNKMYLGLI